MKIYDCFMFSDETMMLDLRIRSLNKYVNKFVITEAKYLHNGDPKKLSFNINDFKEFRNKIEYIVIKEQPPQIIPINNDDDKKEKDRKKITNSIMRDNFQRENLSRGLENLNDEDIVIISDLDEIPNLENLNFNEINNEILIFKQKMFYYKLNLYYENFIWFGSKAVKKRYFYSPQWLRNIKNKKYPFWRIDNYFSKKKYNNIKFIENGGWHFTCIKKPKDIHKKLLTFAHHQDYENSKVSLEELEKKIKERKVLYDHNKDKKNQNKWFSDKVLKKIDLNKLPKIIVENKDKYLEWID